MVTTTGPPSREPCAYCGARPTWPVRWDVDGDVYVLWLCRTCDAAELAALDKPDEAE